jgi:hypothetical protein
VSFDAADAGVLYLDVRYRIRGSNDPRNLVFPFYVIPQHEPLTASVSSAVNGVSRDAVTANAVTGGR